jgi:hypothetical protein
LPSVSSELADQMQTETDSVAALPAVATDRAAETVV